MNDPDAVAAAAGAGTAAPVAPAATGTAAPVAAAATAAAVAPAATVDDWGQTVSVYIKG